MPLSLPVIDRAGIFDSSVKFQNITVTPKRPVELFEVELFMHDGGTTFIDGVEYPIRAGRLLVAKPGQIRNSVLPFQCYYIHLEVQEGAVYRCLMNAPDYMELAQKQIYRNLIHEIMGYFHSPYEGGELWVYAKLLELMYQINQDTLLHQRKTRLAGKVDDRAILQAVSYLDEHFRSSSATLEAAAKAANLSPIYFHKLFSAIIGKTPHAYVLDKKLRYAKELLLTSTLSLTEIAYECGFSSQSYFNYVFKKEVELTPNQFRGKKYLKEYL
ncbi:MAG: DNA-binding protein AraC-type [Paenibacillaceae bacterium]|jgi:AraC-like DNA-binding protein|nr:DNA-binding protein AraC-type [Paenibacillaceae bacterium]